MVSADEQASADIEIDPKHGHMNSLLLMIAIALNTEAMLYVAEIVLAVLLFVDATEVRGGRLWGNSPGLVARVLLIAMPASLVAAMLLGWLLFPNLPWPVLLFLFAFPRLQAPATGALRWAGSTRPLSARRS